MLITIFLFQACQHTPVQGFQGAAVHPDMPRSGNYSFAAWLAEGVSWETSVQITRKNLTEGDGKPQNTVFNK